MEITKTAESYISGYETFFFAKTPQMETIFVLFFSHCRVFSKVKEKLKGKIL